MPNSYDINRIEKSEDIRKHFDSNAVYFQEIPR